MKYETNEKSITIVLFIISLIVAIVSSPKTAYFLSNFLWYWVPQAIVISLLYVFKFRLAIIAGAILALTIDLALYEIWTNLSKDPMVANIWIGYLFTIPGAFVGAVLYGLKIKHEVSISYKEVIISSTIFSVIGIGIIQFILCSTVMYCGF